MVRHRRRVRRRPQRDVHRRVDPLAPARGLAHHDEDLQPDGRGRGSRARAGRACGGRSTRASAGSASSASTSTSRTRGIRDVPAAGGRRRLRGARRRRQDRRLRAQQRRRRPAAPGARGRRVRRRPGLVLAARPRGRGRGAAALRGARPLVPGALPAHGRLADREVPPRRAGARGLADDAAPGPVRAPAHRRRLRRARGARAPRRPGDARARVAARRRACLRRHRPAPPGSARAGARRARRIRSRAEEREALSDEFRLVPES